MLNTPRSRRGMVSAPHHLAAEAGLRVLRDGGTAIGASVAMAGALAVVYPHMTSIGGDGFWLVAVPCKDVVAIDACGRAARTATPELYRRAGHETIPWRGALAANTVAGTVAGWAEALRLDEELGGTLPLSRLLEDAIWHAEHGFAVTRSQAELTRQKLGELRHVPGFAGQFLVGGEAPAEGSVMALPALGRTLRRLADNGPGDFYDGAIARDIDACLTRIGAPVRAADLVAHRAERRTPLSACIRAGEVFNFPPPTQGLASLMILALFDRLGVGEAEGFAHVHGLVECTKQAFLVRDRIVGDPDAMDEACETYLAQGALDRLSRAARRERALDWPAAPDKGDTVWLGAIDANGVAVSMIQSIYFEYGSGCVLPETGIVWQNRGASFHLDKPGPRLLAPGRKPFHTLNPALARLSDGRVMAYGTMGGEGQPQTQSAIFSRYAMFGVPLQEAITRPRWLLGKMWGDETTSLKLESRFDPDLVASLRKAGHAVELLEAFSTSMGHAGAVVRHPNGVYEGASDPRSDGAAMGF